MSHFSEDPLDQLSLLIKKHRKITFFGGAGVSTGSGIPDFRSAQGIFHQPTGTHYSAEAIISHTFYEKYPQEFFEFYFDKLVYPEAQPNSAHRFLAQLEKLGKDVSIVTQNIDGLHQMAGSTKVFELHGSVHRNYCTQCGQFYASNELILDEKGIPRCQQDGAIIKPDVVLYEEGLDPLTITQAIHAIAKADLLIIAGTSLMVYPAASFIQYFQGEDLVVINMTDLGGFDPHALFIRDKVEQVFEALEI